MELDAEDQLHVLIQADNDEHLQRGIDLIEPILNIESGNELKRNALMKSLAVVDTLKDQWCEDCGEKGHRRWECPNRLGLGFKKAEMTCKICGEHSHPTSDCPQKRSKCRS